MSEETQLSLGGPLDPQEHDKPKKVAKKAAKPRKTAAKKAVASTEAPAEEAKPKKTARKAVARKKKVVAEEGGADPKETVAKPPPKKHAAADPKETEAKPPPKKQAAATSESSMEKPIPTMTVIEETPGEEAPARYGRVAGGGPKREGRQGERNGNAGNREGQRQHGQFKRKRRGNCKRRSDRNGWEPREERQFDDGEGGEEERRPVVLEGPEVETSGLLELAPKGYGFLRVAEKHFDQARDDVFVPPDLVRKHGLRAGQWVTGFSQQGTRGAQLVKITDINGLDPEAARALPVFEELKAINPERRIAFETSPDRFTTRVLDLVSPVGRGQRGLIVSPPRSGKTTLLLHLAEAVHELHEDSLHLMILLADERPEEVTEFRRRLPTAEIYASSNDEHPRNHTRIAELCIERAKRLVEAGKDVFLLMDSITRLARAYNNNMQGGGRGRGIGSGGIMVGALETPRRLFAAARNTREAGSLTILATALVQTNSRADEAIFQEFKGTGNMELVLDRKIAEQYIYPAVDIAKSGTRREELLLPGHMLHKIHMIRRGLAGHRPPEAMERLLFFIKKFPNNPQMLLEIKG